MKLAICSDLHLEFGDITLKNEGADVLILGGDIMTAQELHDFKWLLQVPGNTNIQEGSTAST